jgi:chromatin segregation and condensation protein Rec8/ScpA/Scc1 (kleisin family)
MQEIAERLNRSRTDLITQTLEEDVIASLEETLAALQQALEDVRDKRAQQQQQGGGGGNSSEQSLVDQLAEIRMIRALQLRVNRRTEQFGAMIEGEQARESELLDMLDELALRQAKIQQATHDLDTGDNQ